MLLTAACTSWGVWPTSAATNPMMLGFWAASARDSRISCCGMFETSTVALRSTISPRGAGMLDHPHLIARHGGGVALALDDLEGPQAQDEDAEEDQHHRPHHPQAEIGARLLLLG